MSEPNDTIPSFPRTVILDSTALLALGSGNRWLSRLLGVVDEKNPHLLAPALCLTAAVAERPLLADHIGGLSGIDILDLTFTVASVTGALIADGTDWRHAQAIADSRPSLEWPEGLTIVTAEPQAYARYPGLRIFHLT